MVPVVVASAAPANCAPAASENAPLTCQNTRDACAPPASLTCAPAASDSAPFTWITNSAFGSPPASRVTIPDAGPATAAPAVYRPGVNVAPGRAGSAVPPVRAWTSAYAVSMSLYAVASAEPTCIVPTITPGGNPEGCVGAPMSPRTVVAPRLATDAPLITA